ncbi:uncharacterized protein LOC142885811 isoform X2 [Nelusetta ayraudi]
MPPTTEQLHAKKKEADEIRNNSHEWRTASDPKQAARMVTQELFHRNKNSKSLFLSLDVRQDKVDQDRSLVAFYRRDNVKWASPLSCKLYGDEATGSGVDRHMLSCVMLRLITGFHLKSGNAAILKLFEGEPDHLIPSDCEELIENNLFTVAGRIMGHSFLHSGPSFPGLSPAIIHVLFTGSLEQTHLTVQDCPDLDIREMLRLLDSDMELKDLNSIHQLCLSCDLPAPNATNRKRLAKELLFYTVVERSSRQISQLRNGLAETGIWPLLVERRDLIPVLFPRESEAQVTPQMILECIVWPSSITQIFDSYEDEEWDEDEFSTADVCRVSSYLRTFIENGNPAELKSLVKFWIGWELPAVEMKLEIVEAVLPTALTCFEKLRLPRHHTTYHTFHQELCACIATTDYGFGCP